MKHHIRALACGAALLGAIGAVACGGKQTMASKSAAAYDEAKKKGIPIEAGEHGGHAAEPAGAATTSTETAAMPGMDHGAMPGMDHSSMAGMDHSKMPGMQHGASGSGAHDMPGMSHSSMAGMDHSKMPGMKHGAAGSSAHDMTGMDHSPMAGMDHSKMPGMQHGGTMAAMPGMQRGTQVAAPITIPPPTSSSAIAQTQPAATLRPDQFDAPAPTAIGEAAKAASGVNHSMDNKTPNSPASPQHEHPPQPKPKPPSEHHHHGGGKAS
ncbi:MAG TPA: hypothetical protein VII75_04030 [Thermoanaerobaculia bacterium]